MSSDQSTGDGVAQSAVDEWDYQHIDSQFVGEQSVSIPCQLRFVDEVTQDTEAFHDALNERDYASADTNPDRRSSEGRPYYDGEICSTEHHHRVRVLVFRGGLVRLYPHDGYVPDSDELADIIAALTEGFGSEVEHSPIEPETTND